MGREFLGIFEEWAESYDQTVIGANPQYEEVFKDYDIILDKVVENTYGTVLEFGTGTGNLSKRLLEAGHQVIGIEPSTAMRDIAQEKIPDLEVLDGDFINFPEQSVPINTITSTYAFHHLTDYEKEKAVSQFYDILSTDGKIVFADTVFESMTAKQKMIQDAINKGFKDLEADLNREYYPTLDVIERIFTTNNFELTYQQMNDFVWLLIANKR
ncbi:class I SAM-dependent methyltransferase [Ornithinibacillus halophilus]|uniref:Uncharacterized methyltransferase SAMN05216225_102027 n=1 Tax=Ornithinibacillus halophilus TaxID=930117 RepID=A0A1M5HXM6_9BACI|nr:class I SAM-dependent methyltransferase [Ornithinibacillus halophilus]SHG20761.1 putative AdoMet-dependent methyltransferase [Ornithinibacillus halophilus]